MRQVTKLGYQVVNFAYPGTGPEALYEAVACQTEAAERSGFDTVLLMDHLYQLPQLGPPTSPMPECYSLLATLSQRTSSVRLDALVTGNTYRNPAHLAKMVTALDIVSSGRAQLGIGAGRFDVEHEALRRQSRRPGEVGSWGRGVGDWQSQRVACLVRGPFGGAWHL